MAKQFKTAGGALARNKPLPNSSAIRIGDGLENVVAGIGTDRDKRSFSHYCTPRCLTRFELENMYRSSWLAKRIVNTVADDMTQNWREFELEDADDNPQLDSLKDAEKQFKVKAKFNEALRWARLYGGSAIILGTKDMLKASDWATPLDPTRVRLGDLKYLHVLDRWWFAPSGVLTKDLADPNFGLPETYILAESSVEIHHSRLLRFNGQKLPRQSWLQNGMWDDSELQHVIDNLLNYDTMSAALAAMMFEANIDVIQAENLTDLLSTRDGEQKLIKRFQMGMMMKSINRCLVLDSSESYEKKTNSFAGLDKIWGQAAVDVCGASDIPMTRLFGQSPGGLNATGDGDLENYYKRIGADQDTQLRPQLDAFDEVFVRSTLGAIPDGYDYSFNSLWEMDDSDTSAIQYQDAQRDQIYLSAGVVTEGLVASQLKLKGVYQTMSTDDVKLAEELAQSMDEHDDTMRQQQQEAGEINNNNAKKAVTQPPAGGAKANKGKKK